MTDGTGSRGRKALRGIPDVTDEMVKTEIREAMERLADRDRAEAPALRARTGTTGRLVPPVSPEWLARQEPQVRQDRPGLLDRAVRRANGARRGSRALRAILARLVKRANL